MKKILILVVVLVIAGLGFYFFNKNQAKAPIYGATQSNQSDQQGSSTTAVTSPNGQTTINGSTGPDYTPPPTGGGGETTGSDVQVVEVDFNGAAFTPATVTIHQNDWVFFKNKSTVDFWVASNPHPTHTDYPGFDALKNIAPGGEYKFQFTKIGSWGYHDHLDHTIGGTVVVTQ